MISIPQFDLGRERRGALWLGLVFFSFLALVSATAGLLPYLAPPPRPVVPRMPAGRPEIAAEGSRTAAPQRTPRDLRRAIGGMAGAIVLAATTVAPIARELRSRRRPRPRTEKAVGA